MYLISPKHVFCIQKEKNFPFPPTVICGVKRHIIKLKASMNIMPLGYNDLNKPKIIVIKAAETPQYSGWSTSSTSEVIFYY